MINFQLLSSMKEEWRLSYLLAKPFPHLAIDGICDTGKILQLYDEIPDLQTRSRDYVFAANKFERSGIAKISPLFRELYEDLVSEEFRSFLCFISNEDVFVDSTLHGGGLHQGKKDSFLDMHIDFNYHPLHHNWYRTLNLLFYLNKDWQSGHGGQLRLKDLRTGEEKDIGIPLNRLVIQLTGKHTLHGYDRIHFPEGKFRTSIAAYAYCMHRQAIEKRRTTDWHPPDGQPLKKALARIYDPAVKFKNLIFGSSTSKH